MPYQHIEELRMRKNEKVALLLTAENFVGMALAAMPVYIGLANLELGWLRMLLTIVAGLAGIAITLDVGGMALYERILWRVRGRLRRISSGATIRPQDLPGTTIEVRARPFAAAGSVRPVKRQTTVNRQKPGFTP
jgi:hypothetical protein